MIVSKVVKDFSKIKVRDLVKNLSLINKLRSNLMKKPVKKPIKFSKNTN